jgi:hypothetical protein
LIKRTPKTEDSLAERDEFELPVPISEQSGYVAPHLAIRSGPIILKIRALSIPITHQIQRSNLSDHHNDHAGC